MSEGGLIVEVAADSLGAALGLRAGDRLLALNGHPLRDVIDFQFYGAEERVAADMRRDGRTLHLRARRSEGRPWGVSFAEPLFDGPRTCANRCPFCFLGGLPPGHPPTLPLDCCGRVGEPPAGLRPSLYLRDDDYRLSFLYGNFITLTNLDEGDWQRLAEQRLSPLHVSVQATDPDLRRRLLGGAPLPDVREQIARLGTLGIVVEAQVVICPGLNDGAALEQTLSDLWALRDTVESVALVPVGLTRFHPARLQTVTPELARDLLAMANSWRRRAQQTVGRRFVYPADELYLLAGRQVPGAAAYDGFPQLGNGVGLVRRFLDNSRRVRHRLRSRACTPQMQSLTLVTGRAFAPYLTDTARALAEVCGLRVDVLVVENRFWGAEVSVAGLLTGCDVAEQLRAEELGDVVILPRSMFDAAGERTLDDWTLSQLAQALARPVALADSAGDIVRMTSRRSRTSGRLDSEA